MFKKIIISLTIILPFLTSHAADISLVGQKEGSAFIFVTGDILKGDSNRIKNEYKKISGDNSVGVLISSGGGSIYEAMAIGDFIDENNISVLIPSFGKCESSCVLILAAGDYKTAKPGQVGIHRPYFESSAPDPKKSAEQVKETLKSIKIYLASKGIPEFLAEEMFSTPPNKIKYLTENELTKYRLNQRNYIKKEEADLKTAKSMGIGREKYMEMMEEVNSQCTLDSQEPQNICFEKIYSKYKKD